MRLGALRRSWERFGRDDPYWAVLTHKDKRGGQWDVDAFYRSGALEIEATLQRARERGLDVRRGRALDFGCGAGRLTQAMADHFAHADGVDISRSMVRLARARNRHPQRCTYHVNVAPELSLFPSGAFDFVYTTLVLQHMEQRYSTRYVEELVRVLAPHGLLVFQLPSRRSADEPPPDAARTIGQGPLPDAAFRARIAVSPAPLTLHAGESRTMEVTIVNGSPVTWSCGSTARDHHRVNVANRWLDEDGEVLQRDDARCPLPFDVQPEHEVTVLLVVTAPAADGRYQLEVDLVQEDVAWFGDLGSPVCRIPVVVGEGCPRPRHAARSSIEVPTFRHRHPRAHAVMRATGIRDAYWAWRRGVDRVKTVRDRGIVNTRKRLQIPRLVNWWKRGPRAPTMEMHCVPRADVESTVAGAGGVIVDVEQEWAAGFQSCRYWVRKRDSSA
jgi:SAM-dependent methyltransferase